MPTTNLPLVLEAPTPANVNVAEPPTSSLYVKVLPEDDVCVRVLSTLAPLRYCTDKGAKLMPAPYATLVLALLMSKVCAGTMV